MDIIGSASWKQHLKVVVLDEQNVDLQAYFENCS